MAEIRIPPPPGDQAPYPAGPGRSGVPAGRALLAAGLIVAACVVLGVAGGLIWAAVAPRVVYQVSTLSPPTAVAINPETSAFIAADGTYCVIALVGGVLAGVFGYQLVRRYGPVPMVGLVVGSVAAAFLAMWIGHLATGASTFDHVLSTSKTGVLLRAPISLGADSALAFWPLAAAVVAGGAELANVLRERRQPAGS
jgi:hypothetical protein